MSGEKTKRKQKNYHKKKSDNRFYIIYNADGLGLPVAVENTLNDVAAFFGKKYDSLKSDISKFKTNPAYKTGGIKAANGKRYTVTKWEEVGELVKEI